MIFILTLVIVIVLNLYIIIFGKKDLDALKKKISVKQYLKEIEKNLVEISSDKAVTAMKVAGIVLAIIIGILNIFAIAQIAFALPIGMLAAKKIYQVPSLANKLNKLATYINRLR